MDLRPSEIKYEFSYKDVYTDKQYQQKIYMKWSGVKDGVTKPIFSHATIEDQQRMEEYLNKQLENQKGPTNKY